MLPIFPLPDVTFFPHTFLPLHVFEARYRAMITDALARDRRIVVARLRPGFEADYEGRPPVYPVGCAGVITHNERLADGRYNIVLRGIEKFRIVDEDTSRAYRLAHIDPLPEWATIISATSCASSGSASRRSSPPRSSAAARSPASRPPSPTKTS